MAEECSSTPPPSSWWEYYNCMHLSSTSPWHNTQNPSSHSSCEDQDHVSINTSSFTNVSNRSGLTSDSSPRLIDHDHRHDPSYEVAPDNNLWTNVLIQDVKESYYDDVLPSRSNLSYDYLKKMDSSNTWELNNFDKQFSIGGYVENNNFVDEEEGERPANNKFSSFVDNTSVNEPQRLMMSLHTDVSSMKQMFNDLTLCHIPMKKISSLNNLCYVDPDHINININHHQRPYDHSVNIGNNGLFGHVSNKYDHGVSDSSCANIGRNFDNQHGIFSTSKLSKPASVEFHASSSKLYMKSSSLSDSKKQRPRVTSSLSVKENGRGQEGKKKRFEDHDSHSVTKKPKIESSSISCIKMQGPKMKVNEKIASLQQIVCPFGKTDTASVLFEAIGHIKCLQDHMKTLLSNPYLKVNVTKLQEAWGHMERKFDRGDLKVDLKTRGLCLVPISRIPQIYRDNTGSDYWTPTYRGCLYR